MAEWKRLARTVWTQFPDRASVKRLEQLRQLSGSQ
jgi:hypothetical protein